MVRAAGRGAAAVGVEEHGIERLHRIAAGETALDAAQLRHQFGRGHGLGLEDVIATRSAFPIWDCGVLVAGGILGGILPGLYRGAVGAAKKVEQSGLGICAPQQRDRNEQNFE
ncbi:MAG: hypothetical protein PHY45_14210 [Rhodocyclaceae bacterium]|nr:hypothetical protein [Rhodocyclaceae bacterium]